MEVLSRLTPQSNFKIERLDLSVSDLPFEVVAGALPTDRLQKNLLMAYHMFDRKALIEAGYIVHNGIACDYAVMYNWKVPEPGVIIHKAMAFQAVIEIVNHNTCTVCQGIKGHITDEDKTEEVTGIFDGLGHFHKCDTCNGAGIKHLTREARFNAIQGLDIAGVWFDKLNRINRQEWLKKWAYRFDLIYEVVLDEFNKGTRHLRSQLNELS